MLASPEQIFYRLEMKDAKEVASSRVVRDLASDRSSR
jgi:hypothetical protein